MAHIGKSNKNNWNFIFSSVPGNPVRSDEKFKLNITNLTLPGVTLEETYIPFNGTKIYDAIGVEYDSLQVSSLVDSNYENYFTIYDWMMGIYNGFNKFGGAWNGMQTEADLHLLDSFGKLIRGITFHNIWPVSMGAVDLSYQDSEKMNMDITFRFDFMKKST